MQCALSSSETDVRVAATNAKERSWGRSEEQRHYAVKPNGTAVRKGKKGLEAERSKKKKVAKSCLEGGDACVSFATEPFLAE